MASSIRTARREKFLKMIREGVPFEKAAERALQRSLLERVQRKVHKLTGAGASSGLRAGASKSDAAPAPSGRGKKKEDAPKPPVLFVRKEQCSGCTACEQICPAGAVAIREDEDGFVYPQILSDKCIGCGRCERVCPMRHHS